MAPTAQSLSSRPESASRPPIGERRTRPIYRVFVSSTWLDLQPERRALMDALNRMEEMRFVGMEFFGNRPDDTHDASIDQVDLCEVFVGIIGHRYGSGITEAEYRRARELGLPCFVYFKHDAEVRPELTDGDAALAVKLAGFKQDLLRGHTVKEFATPEELAANATADLHNWVAARWISFEHEASAETRTPTAPSDADRTNTLRLLDRIQHDWIEGVLEASLHRRAWMDLGLDWKDEAVEQPWDRILVAPDRPVKTLGDRDTIAGVFASAQNTLLVLGEPGAGKTTTLLELARGLVRRARESAAEPPPVVLALSTWTGRHRSLREWLLEELNVRYQVPKRLATGWLEAGRLALLLDGLDEVREEARAACVTAINNFAREHAPAGLAVTCRVAEYAALHERLQLRSAICLQPLTTEQIEAYFARAGLAGLGGAIREDAALGELAQTPLMLSVMTVAWRDVSAEALRGGAGTTVEQRRRQLLAAYVQTALRRKGSSETDPAARTTLDVLGWLARQMRRHGQTLFAVEQLQPDALDGVARQAAYFFATRMLALLALGLPFWFFEVSPSVKWMAAALGLADGLALGAIDLALFRWMPVRFAGARQRGMALVVLFVFAPLMIIPLVARLAKHAITGDLSTTLACYAMLIAASLSTLVEVKTRDIRPADAFSWSWRQGLRRAAGVVVVWQWFLIIGFLELAVVKGWSVTAELWGVARATFALGACAGMALGGVLAWRWQWRDWALVARVGALATLGGQVGANVFGPGPHDPSISVVLSAPCIVLLIGGVTAGLDETRARRTGVWFWARVPLLAALTVSAVIGGIVAVLGLTSAGANQWPTLLMMIGIFGSIVGLVVFVRFGGFQGMQHWILRQLLAQSGAFPRRAVPLLDDAVRLNLLQKVGSGYRFIHALLLDHFADAGENSPAAGR